jgi:hypothetical protein
MKGAILALFRSPVTRLDCQIQRGLLDCVGFDNPTQRTDRLKVPEVTLSSFPAQALEISVLSRFC